MSCTQCGEFGKEPMSKFAAGLRFGKRDVEVKCSCCGSISLDEEGYCNDENCSEHHGMIGKEIWKRRFNPAELTEEEFAGLRLNSWEQELLVPLMSPGCFKKHVDVILKNCRPKHRPYHPCSTYDEAAVHMLLPEAMRRLRSPEQWNKMAQDLDQARVQLAGTLCAAEGAVGDDQVAKKTDYGWSLAYQQVVDLRRKYDQLVRVLDPRWAEIIPMFGERRDVLTKVNSVDSVYLEAAARAWCTPSTSKIPMIPELAGEFGRILQQTLEGYKKLEKIHPMQTVE